MDSGQKRRGQDQHVRDAIKESIECQDDNRVADLHLWSIGPDIYATELTVVTHDPQPPEHYQALLPLGVGLAHANVEVHRFIHEDELEEARALREKRAENAG